MRRGASVQVIGESLELSNSILKKSLFGQHAKQRNRFQTLRNNSYQHATTCSRVWTQHVTSNNVGRFSATMLTQSQIHVGVKVTLSCHWLFFKVFAAAVFFISSCIALSGGSMA